MLLRLLLNYYFLGASSIKFILENIVSFYDYIPQTIINTIVLAPFAFSVLEAFLISISVWIHSLTISSKSKEERKEIRRAFAISAIISIPILIAPFPFSLISAILYPVILSRKLKKITKEKYSFISTIITIPMVSLIILFLSIFAIFIIWLI